MKTAIIFASVHHGNTRKIVEQIARNNDVDLIDATQVKEKDLSEYDRIGFASDLLSWLAGLPRDIRMRRT